MNNRSKILHRQKWTKLCLTTALCLPASTLAWGQDTSTIEPAAKLEVGDDSNAPELEATEINRGDLIVVVGAAGEENYEPVFREWSGTWMQLAKTAKLNAVRIGDASTKSELDDLQLLEKAMQGFETDSPRPLWISLIGHGTFARNVAKFNLRGPDVSADQMKGWLAGFKRPVVIVNNASSSGPFINALSGPNRIIVTATKSGNEQNFARFGQYFAEALASLDSDLDHDDAVSIREAFVRASKDVELFYEAEDRIATEHALIDDNGDGLGSQADDLRKQVLTPEQLAKLDGKQAGRMTIAPVANSLNWTDDQLRRRDELEDQLDALRMQRLSDPAAFPDNQWADHLEEILVPLAELYHEVESNSPP
ncbi:putative signal peptide protein [Rhodopirellula islandica]|uniref:Signal peptide protein n=1 Tax=Rhodopirellula islandica TaxID=595434 RepID=A0A0J1B9Q9_RHOIS|nr:hypothetical protein [Rhodopirellula islandica]KLU03216.1 putative signal peptide protein [Rhodopirellula islandica]